MLLSCRIRVGLWPRTVCLDIPVKIQVALFLKEFKGIVTTGRGLYIIDRQKNTESLLELGLTKRNCREEILNLSVENYCNGPKPDFDRPGMIWEFGKKINGDEIYIKLKIAEVGSEKLAKCISFHKAEFPLNLPLKGNQS